MVTDQTGKPVERYTYTPYGERTIYVDSTPPKVEQVRVVDGALWLEISEAVSSEALQAAVARERSASLILPPRQTSRSPSPSRSATAARPIAELS